MILLFKPGKAYRRSDHKYIAQSMRDLVKKFIKALPKWARSRLLPLLLTIRVGGLIIAALAMWGFADLAEEILEKESFAFDRAILLALKQLHTPLLDQIMLWLTFMGEPSLLTVICFIIGCLLLFYGKRSQATTLIIAALGAGGLNYLLKILFARARPQLWERTVDVRFYSFPSGHAMVSMVIYGVIGYLLATTFPKWRGLIISATAILILGIGFTRLYLGVHWPTDVIAGYAAGIVWLVACIFSLEVWQARRSVTQASE